MNFLAHLYLSGTDPEIMIGNFIGDFVKGKEFEQFQPGLQKGIILHREIDRFTDTHPTVKQSKRRLHPGYHHYAAVIADVFYDHYLAANWHLYHNTPLLEYTETFYKLTDSWLNVFPEKAKYMLKYMRADNWLYNYQHVEGVNRALTGMSRRTKFDSGMDRAVQDLKADYEAYKEEFKAFFPELTEHSKQFLKSLE